MAKILHVCNSFDPAGDVVRCVDELRRYSRHEHLAFIYEPHPGQDLYQFRASEYHGRNVSLPLVESLFDWADGVIYHFVGWERGCGIRTSKPHAFRNSNIYFSVATNRFWSNPDYTASSLDGYKLLASSHMCAREFLPDCLLLPVLIPIDDPLYLPNFNCTRQCISVSKQQNDFSHYWVTLAGTGKRDGLSLQSLGYVPHSVYMRERRSLVTCTIDNISDGHYGLAGLEGLSMGLASVVFNHPTTRLELEGIAPEYPPFIECQPSIEDAMNSAIEWCLSGEQARMELRKESRNWMEKYYHSRRIIQRFWDPFVDELMA